MATFRLSTTPRKSPRTRALKIRLRRVGGGGGGWWWGGGGGEFRSGAFSSPLVDSVNLTVFVDVVVLLDLAELRPLIERDDAIYMVRSSHFMLLVVVIVFEGYSGFGQFDLFDLFNRLRRCG